jgi:YidC/Oxa1 family membrane protein insertase
MDNQRLLIWGLFGFLAWITYQTWVQDYAPKPAAQATQTVDQPGLAAPHDGGDGIDGGDDLPELSVPTEGGINAPAPVDIAVPAVTPAASSVPTIRVKTDVLDVEISLQGGTLQSAYMTGYPVAKDSPDTLIQLLSADPSNFGAIQTGLRIAGEGDEPNHRAMFVSSSDYFDMGDAETLVVPLQWKNADGISVEKRFHFTRGGYAIVIEQEVNNGSSGLWRGADYAQLQRIFKEQERSMFDVDSYSFAGPIVYNGEKAEKLKHDDLLEDGPTQFKSQNGWLGAIQHHFLSALVPTPDTEQSYSVSVRGDRSTASMIGLAQSIAPGSGKTFSTTAFVGPKLQSQLEEVHEKLTLTVDYGWLTIISNPLFMILRFVFEFVGNWGLAIILVTFMIKLVFYKLTESSGRSMAKMRGLQPRMKALQDRYKDDKPALSAAMMELYKREKVNPAAGCLPILIQMPFFLAFYWVLLESVEMRQAPFALWITDLSTKDPYFILPLIMGAAMFMQQKLNPAPADPVQAKVMQIMPIMFTGFFAFFPSGLVLYWVTNTLLSIAQQWKINTVVEREAKAKKH